VEFSPPVTMPGCLDDEETMPLNVKASTPNHKCDIAGAAESSDHDEDLDVYGPLGFYFFLSFFSTVSAGIPSLIQSFKSF